MTSLGGFVKIVDHSNMCADVLFESFCACVAHCGVEEFLYVAMLVVVLFEMSMRKNFVALLLIFCFCCLTLSPLLSAPYAYFQFYRDYFECSGFFFSNVVYMWVRQRGCLILVYSCRLLTDSQN